MATEVCKKAFFSAIKWLNVAFAGYEVSTIAKPHKNSQTEITKINDEVNSKLNEQSRNHTTVLIVFFIVLCLLYALAFGFKVILRVQKRKVQKRVNLRLNDISATV